MLKEQIESKYNIDEISRNLRNDTDKKYQK